MRAFLTYELADFAAAAEVDCDLLEWNCGNYDGRASVDIHAERPDWLLFRDGCPWRGHAYRRCGPGRSRWRPSYNGTMA
jgi:broad specificity phosphatase PhoE